MQQLKVNTSLQGGQYYIEQVLGQGSFGITYRGYDIMREERVAIKEFFMKGVTERDETDNSISVSDISNYATFREQKEKFRKEAKRLSALSNSHIVRVHNQFEENGTAYYVMDYVDGENLRERMNRTGQPLTEDEVWNILPQVLDALKTVHDAGLWHLDLKPGNIMIDKYGYVKLIDFGASKQIDPHRGGATAHTTISFTPGYAPREQMDQRYEKFGPWTDIYALGATLYALLTCKRPPLPSDIDDDSSADKHMALALPSYISERMRNLVVRMMSTNRKYRPQSVDEVMPDFSNHSEETAYEHEEDEGTQFTQSAQDYEGTEFSQSANSHEETEYSQSSSRREETEFSQTRSTCDDSNHQFNEGQSSYNGSIQNSEKSSGVAMNWFLLIVIVIAVIAIAIGIAIDKERQSETIYPSVETQQESSATYGKKEVYFYAMGYGVYEGGLKDGEMHGHGTITYSSGQRFTGEFVNGVTNGHGTLTSANGQIIFDGEYVNGQRSKGTQTFDNGSIYTGTYSYGYIKNGTLKSAEGEILAKGEFVGGVIYNGYGKETGDGYTYEGDFNEGYWHGKGTITWDNGKKYVGDFVKGERTGYGVFTWPETRDGYSYKYEGEFRDGKHSGQGTMYFLNAGKYTGTWANDARNGIGTEYYSDHTYQKGVWKNDELQSVTEEGTWH